jgi:hypothetical protein
MSNFKSNFKGREFEVEDIGTCRHGEYHAIHAFWTDTQDLLTDVEMDELHNDRCFRALLLEYVMSMRAGLRYRH